MYEKDVEVISQSRDEEWVLALINNKTYMFFHRESDGLDIAETPGGNAIETSYRILAERLMQDIVKYGIDCYAPESIVPWHFTTLDNFSKMEHEEIESVLDESFLQKQDWTLDSGITDKNWIGIFGEPQERRGEIRRWLSKCTHMQLSAVCCIGNAHHSLNIAYVVARSMESYEGLALLSQLKQLAIIVGEQSAFSEAEDLLVDFGTFKLYYGIHLEEEGAIINQKLPESGKDKYLGKDVSVEALVGRNYYHYTEGMRDIIQPLALHISDFSLDCDELYMDDEDLSAYLSPDSWVKKIRFDLDGREAYFLLEVVLEGGRIKNANAFLQENIPLGNGMVSLPGMEMPSQAVITELEYLPDECEEELERLLAGRYIGVDDSFIGKRLPEAIIDEGSNNEDDTEYTFAYQSAFRQAYMHMSITTSEDGIIEDFDYSTYRSSGSSFGDMFSRPQYCMDREDEAIDMLLYIVDSYTDEEYKEVAMGLFSRLKKEATKKETAKVETTKEVWRDKNGKIDCPGDSCPKDCDDSCPIYLNTQAIMMTQMGQSIGAFAYFEKALAIAPDFYDVWNNLAGIYGQKKNFQKAYDCYKKARELNKDKPNPVYGLMLTSRDLGKYEECLSWCDVYKSMVGDGREKTIRETAKRMLGSAAK